MKDQSIDSLLEQVNSVWSCGRFELIEDEEGRQVGFEEVLDDDIVIYYDYADDELGREETNKLVNWLYDDPKGGWLLMKSFLRSKGYVEVDEHDGSGNGLYYGATLFRKRGGK